MKWLTLSGRFAPSSPEGRAFDKTANSAGNAKASHFGGGGSALALTERVRMLKGESSMYQEVAGGICAPKGFAAAGVHCGIRANHNEKYDLALIKAEVRCAAAGVYTTNKVCGAPIKVDRAHLKDGYAQAILVNSGNANTCAANGVALAEECCALVGEALNIPAEDVLPASTGVIGQPMVIDPFARGIPAAAAKLTATAQGSTDAATAIMTTDTHKKEYAIQFELGGKTCTVGAIGKGSGMIAPNMATMLAFYTTDAAVSPALLEKALKTVVPGTYNQMSVDLDTSTNDTLIIMASGLAGNPEICEENADYDAFVAALTAIAEMAPRTVVMVSCNAATAARDAKWLTEHGYKAVEVQPVDLFPRTKHVECVVKMVHG